MSRATASASRERALPDVGDPRDLRVNDAQFDSMCAAFHVSAGLARGDDVALLIDERRRGSSMSLARLIETDKVFGFERDGTLWVPMFQFEPDRLHVRPCALKVRAELAAEFDGWEVASWFAAPNAYLRGQRPVDLLDSNLREVLGAARIDRYIAGG